MKVLACTLAAVDVTAWASVAVALDITFDDVMSVGNPPLTMLDIQGYRFTGAFRTIDTPGGALVSNAAAVYLGQETSGPGITVARAEGGPFILYEFDAAGLYVASSPGAPNAQQVTLAGFRVGGGMLSATYAIGSLPGFAHVSVPSTWNDLQAVTFTGLLSAAAPGAFALDDVGVGEGPTPVSEPGTLALALIAALGAGRVTLTRRRGQPFRHR